MLAMLFLATPIAISSAEPIPLESSLHEVTLVCSSSQEVTVKFQNSWKTGQRGRVLSVKLDNIDVPGIANDLQKKAGNRTIEFIGISDCGWNEKEPIIKGEMHLSQLESKRDGKDTIVFFHFSKYGIIVN